MPSHENAHCPCYEDRSEVGGVSPALALPPNQEVVSLRCVRCEAVCARDMTPVWLGLGGLICGVCQKSVRPSSRGKVVFKSLSSETSDRCIVPIGKLRVFLGGGPELSCVFGVLFDRFWLDFVSLGPRPQPSRLLVFVCCLCESV